MIRAIYAGSFDPITNGHVWVINEAIKLFENLKIVVARNPNKKYMFSWDERANMLNDSIIGEETFETFSMDQIRDELLINYAKERSVTHLIRGIRNESDYEYEKAMQYVNSDIDSKITTVYLIPPRELCEVSSSLVKGLTQSKGWEDVVKKYVPNPVLEKLKERE